MSTPRPVGRDQHGGGSTSPLAGDALAGYGLATLRITLGLIWLHEAAWKRPPLFGSDDGGGLWQWARFPLEHPVFAPYTWFVEAVVVPNFLFFAWSVYLLEAALAGFLLAGLLTRLWAVLGVVQALAITFSVVNVPNEWALAYFLFIAAHVAVGFAAAGRTAGMDGALRPAWSRAGQRTGWEGRLGRLAVRLS